MHSLPCRLLGASIPLLSKCTRHAKRTLQHGTTAGSLPGANSSALDPQPLRVWGRVLHSALASYASKVESMGLGYIMFLLGWLAPTDDLDHLYYSDRGD
jgi:hypothetical protein